jgi:hypothetical protein
LKQIIPAIVIIFLGLWIHPAMAYIDPGSGSAIMSAIIGLFVAVGLAIKTYWYKLKSIFTGKGSDVEVDANQELEDRE